MTALEQGCWHLEDMGLIRRENEVFGAFWQGAHRSDSTLRIIRPSNFGFDDYPAATSRAGYTGADNSITHLERHSPSLAALRGESSVKWICRAEQNAHLYLRFMQLRF
jgi:hypothetical protein